MKVDFVSVVIPCYNQAHYLDEALQSIIHQTHKNWECIIVNDGSTDHTESVVKKWELKDVRFKYISKKNGGLSSARNAGLKLASGNYIQFLDADDVLAPTKLEESLAALKNTPKNAIAVTDFLMLSNKTNQSLPPFCELKQELINPEEILYNWDVKFTIPIHCGLFPATASKNIGFEESLKGKEDWVFWIKISRLVSKLYFIDKPLVHYRLNPDSMSRADTQMKEYHKQALDVLSNYLDPHEYTSLLRFRLNHSFNRLSEINKEKQTLKNSNTYQAGRMIKKILRGLGLLKVGRWIFQYVRTFKKPTH